MMRILGIVVLGATLAGCGVVARMEDRQEYVKARQQYEDSLAVYRSCLAANSANLKTCEGSASQLRRMKEPSTIFPDMPPTSMCNNDKDHGGLPKNEDRAGRENQPCVLWESWC